MFDEENSFLLKDERQADVGFSGKKSFFVVILRNSGLTYSTCDLLKAWCMFGEDGCVERSEATFRTNLVNRWFSFSGTFYIFLGKVTGSVNFKNLWLWQPWLTLVSFLNGRPVLPELYFYFKAKYFQKLFRADLINGYGNIAHYYVAYFTYIFLFDDITIELSKRQSRWYSV